MVKGYTGVPLQGGEEEDNTRISWLCFSGAWVPLGRNGTLLYLGLHPPRSTGKCLIGDNGFLKSSPVIWAK